VESALARYEERLKPAIERQQNAVARIATWLVPDDELHLLVRNALARVSMWRVIAPILRRRLTAESIFSSAADSAN
jgi:hypothetical protein